MALGKKKPSSALGKNPLKSNLSKGIFSKTDNTSSPENVSPAQESTTDPVIQESLIKNKESRISNQESSFLINSEKEKVNLRLPIELNDWLDDLVKQGKRNHGHKIPKEVWVQAALELFRSLPINWAEVDSVETLKGKLDFQESRMKNIE